MEHSLKKEDVTRKSGDDFAARIYLVFPRIFFWQTRAITYVWAARLPGSRGFQKIFAIKTMLPDVSDGFGDIDGSVSGDSIVEALNLFVQIPQPRCQDAEIAALLDCFDEVGLSPLPVLQVPPQRFEREHRAVTFHRC